MLANHVLDMDGGVHLDLRLSCFVRCVYHALTKSKHINARCQIMRTPTNASRRAAWAAHPQVPDAGKLVARSRKGGQTNWRAERKR